MKEKFDAIILVVASQDEDVKNTRYIIKRLVPEWQPMYPVMKAVWQQYMLSEPSIKVIFVYGGGEKYFEIQENDWIYEDVFENNHPGMITKTMRALEDVEKRYDYQYVIRTNLSTFWDFSRLKKRLNSLPKNNCLAGTRIDIKDRENNSYRYVAGYDLIMSRDLVQQILPYNNEIITQNVYCNMEDLSLCTTIYKYTNAQTLDNIEHSAYQIKMDPFDIDIYNQHWLIYQNSVYDHFRVKTRYNRNADKKILEQLLQDVYGKSIL